MNVIGPRIKELREQQKLTQAELAARCNVIGLDISRGTLGKIEAQVRRLTDGEVAQIAEALNVDVNELYL